MGFRVAILMESSLEISRDLLRGIIHHVRASEPWTLDITPGGIGDQRLPESWRGDGIIARIPSVAEAARLAACPVPKVILDPQGPFAAPGHPLAACARVESDHGAIGRVAASHLLGRGFRHFAYVGPTLSSSPQMAYDATGLAEPNWSLARRDAFLAALAAEGHGAAVYPRPRTRRAAVNWNLEMPALVQWLLRLPRPLAVFTPHDARGRQVLDACHAARLPVPYQVAVLGVNDDSTLCETALPPLSSIRLDAVAAGRRAAEMLDALMAGRRPAPWHHHYGCLGVTARDSTAAMQTDDAVAIAVLEDIRTACGFNLRVSEVAARHGFTVRALEKRFRRAIGQSVGAVIRTTCLDHVRRLVTESDRPFGDIARACGPLSAAHLAAASKARCGAPMTAARARALPAATASRRP